MNQEQHRLETEARAWLKAGYVDKKSVAALRTKIAKKRGYNEAVRLIEEMRKQYRQQVKL